MKKTIIFILTLILLIPQQGFSMRPPADGNSKKPNIPKDYAPKWVKNVRRIRRDDNDPQKPAKIKMVDIMPSGITNVYKAIYMGERYIAKLASNRVIDGEDRFIIPSAAYYRYLNENGFKGIVKAEHFLEFKDGKRLILFEDLNNVKPGKILQNKITEEGALDAAQAIDIAIKLSKIVQSLHNANIYHWDIRPDNIWIANDGEIILIDFDLAFSTMEEFLERKLYEMGNWTYQSPRRRERMQTFSYQDEVFALARTLLSTMRNAPIEIKQVIDNGLEKTEQQYSTVQEFITALEACREENPELRLIPLHQPLTDAAA